MALNKALITPEEADVFLAMYPDWIALDTPAKTDHIAKASVYLQTHWLCEDVDWSDESTLDEDVKESCAYYALADSVGTLYTSPDSTEETMGLVSEQTSKLGSLQTTVKYCCNNRGEKIYPLGYADALMGTQCEKLDTGAGSRKTIRV